MERDSRGLRFGNTLKGRQAGKTINTLVSGKRVVARFSLVASDEGSHIVSQVIESRPRQ